MKPAQRRAMFARMRGQAAETLGYKGQPKRNTLGVMPLATVGLAPLLVAGINAVRRLRKARKIPKGLR